MNGERSANPEERVGESGLDDAMDELADVDEDLDGDSSGGSLDGDAPDVGDSDGGSDDYSPQNRYRQNQQYHDRQYYKDRVNETGEKRDQAKKDADEARQKRTTAKDKYQQSKQNYRDNRGTGSRSDAKADKKGAKKDYKDAKKADKEARRGYRDAKRANRQAKFDRVSDAANRVMHPVETGKNYLRNKVNQINPINKLRNKAKQGVDAVKDKAKQGVKNTAKKAGKAAGKAAKAAGKTIIKGVAKLLASIPPPVWIALAIITAITGIVLLIMVIFIGAEDEGLQGLSATTCTYENMNGVSDETYVAITSCDTGEVIDTVSLEKYVAGVAINNLGNDYNSEVMKAELIIIRSSILANAVSNTDNSYDSSENIITKSQCDDKNFYWDYTKNLYKSEGDTPVYSYDETLGYPLYKEALSSEDVISLESTAKQVSCMYLTDSGGQVVSVEIIDELIEKLNEQATNNDGSDNGAYTALLLQNIDNATGVASGQTNNASYFSDEVGEYSQWKQLCSLNAPWCNVCMNKSCKTKINDAGCALTSLAMLIAHSGVDTSKIPNFNPGTFTDAMRDNGYLGSGGGIRSWAYVTNLVPNFVFHKKIYAVNGDISKVKAYADQGYYIVLEVKQHIGGQHYVAVDNAASAAAGWSDIYVWNPSGNITHLKENKNYRANSMLVYEVKR